MGKAPSELSVLPNLFLCAFGPNPKEDIIAGGCEYSTVLLAAIGGWDQRVLPLCSGQKSARGKVTGISFTPQGGAIIFGTEEGTVGVVDLSAK